MESSPRCSPDPGVPGPGFAWLIGPIADSARPRYAWARCGVAVPATVCGGRTSRDADSRDRHPAAGMPPSTRAAAVAAALERKPGPADRGGAGPGGPAASPGARVPSRPAPRGSVPNTVLAARSAPLPRPGAQGRTAGGRHPGSASRFAQGLGSRWRVPAPRSPSGPALRGPAPMPPLGWVARFRGGDAGLPRSPNCAIVLDE